VSAELVQFPERDMSDVPRMLRSVADSIEAGEYGDAHNLAWVIDCGAGRIEVGLCGKAPEPGLTGHFLLACGQRKIENGSIE
jgi:hypothetical protein